MSWFDSSFSFAKTALSQAQKSIDKVLDIKEAQSDNDPPITSNVTATPSTPVEVPKSEKTTSTSHAQPKSLMTNESNTTPTTSQAPPPTHSTSEVFESTWGVGDSTWGTPLTSPPPAKSSSKESNAQRSKVPSSSLKTTTPTGRSERHKKTRQSKPQSGHVTSTPISEGGGAPSLNRGARDSHGKAITPVKPVEQATSMVTASEKPEEVIKRDTVEEPSEQRTEVSTTTGNSSEDVQLPRPPQETTCPSADQDQTTGGGNQTDTVPLTPPANEFEQAPPTRVDELVRSPPTAANELEQAHPTKLEQTPPTNGGSTDCVQLTDHTDGRPGDSHSTQPSVGEKLIRESSVTEREVGAEGVSSKSNTESGRPEPLGVFTDGKVPQGKSEDVDKLSTSNQTSSAVAETEGVGGTGTEGRGLSDHSQEGGETVQGYEQEGGVSKEIVESLKMESSRLSELLEAREAKMVDMSRQIVSLTEENQKLQEELAVVRETGQSDVEDMRAEFTRRIGASDKKLQAVTKERDSLRKQLQAVQTEQSQQKKSHENSLTKLLQEKEEQVAQLMEEGEKLSKQELQSNSTIKKLRQKERQNDQLLTSQKQHIEDLESKIGNLKEQCKKREEAERKYQESLAQLNTIAEQQAKELTTLKAERDGLTDKVRSLQTNLDNAYKELADLQKENAVSQTAAQEAAMSAQSSAREELKGLLEKQKIEAQRQKEAVLLQLEELRMTMTRAEQLSARKEDHLRQEISDLQERLQEAESRNQDLTSTISQATKPLLRQIENIQAAHSAQAANWERVETNLTQRLVELQAQLSQSTEKERAALEKEMTLQSRMTVLETQASTLRQEKSHLLASEELIKAKFQTIEEEQQRESAKIEGLRASFQRTVDDLRKDKELLERQLEYERVRLEAESKKARLEAQEKERLQSQLVSFSPLGRPAVGRQSSTGSVHSQGELLEHSLHSLSESGNTTPTDAVDHHTHSLKGGSASVIEHLQSLLKQKEGELSTSQTFVGTLERSRSALAEDLSSLSAENESLKTQVEEIAPLREKLLGVERKHEAMLQMYGEKAEEAEELKLDILDLKAMYRQQIDELLSGRR